MIRLKRRRLLVLTWFAFHDLCFPVHVLTSLQGGTSTDISRYDGEYEHLMETTIAGRTIAAPMLSIQTVAAGGGSILSARNGLFVVGPEVIVHPSFDFIF